MSEGPFVSYAQNAEDVVLWRTLRHVTNGHYVEVGANHPSDDSITKAFYDRGWSGITVEPLEELSDLHRSQRPRDLQVRAAVSDGQFDSITLHSVVGSGLSSTVDDIGDRHRSAGWNVEDIVVPSASLDDILADAGWTSTPIHFMIIDVEGAEGAVLRGLDLRAYRPWVLVVEATEPNSTEQTHGEWEPGLLAAGYTFCLFDGLSRFYVADEHRETLASSLSYPAYILDNYVPARLDRAERAAAQLGETLADTERQLIRWRHRALVEWAELAAAATSHGDVQGLAAQLEAFRNSTSWRITGPLRALSRSIGRRR